MIYLYFDGGEKKLYLFENASDMTVDPNDVDHACWENIETVTTDRDRGQIVAHGHMGRGIVVEFPLSRSVLTCQKPI